MIDQLVAALDVIDRCKDMYRRWKNPPQESVGSRFLRLFEEHGVHRNQIPRFFGHGLNVSDVQNDASLMLKLDEAILEDACQRFAVRRTWLDGVDSRAYPCHHFATHPGDFAQFIAQLRASNPEGELNALLIAPSRPALNAQALLVLQEYIGELGDKAVYRYHLCTDWVYEYWKSRAYLAACVAVAWKAEVYVRGLIAAPETIATYADGHTLLNEELIHKLDRSEIYPEDMALDPVAFLYKLDFEDGNYGVREGLKLWLRLEQEGFMNLGRISKNVRPAFQAELEKYYPVQR